MAIGLISCKVSLATALPYRSSSSTMALAMLSSFRTAMLRSGFASLSGTLHEIKPLALKMRVFLLLLLFLIGSPLSAMNLTDSLKLSVKNYPGLKAEYEDLCISAARIDFARSGYRPTITGTLQVGKLRFYDSALDLKQKTTPKLAGVHGVQPLFRGGRTVSAINRAKHVYAAEQCIYAEEVDELIQSVAVAYIDVLREQEVLKANQNNQLYLTRELKAVEDRFSLGDVTQTDLFQSKARLAGADARLAESFGRVEGVKAVLEKFVGSAVSEVEDPKPLLNLPLGLEETIKKVLCQNKPLKAQNELYKAALQAYYEVKGELYPELYIEGRLEEIRDLFIRGEYTNERSAFLTLKLPVYEAGRVQARMREAAAVARKERALYETLCLELRQKSIQAWEAREVVIAQIGLFKAQVEANQVALEGVKREELAGLRTVLDVLNAESELLNAKVNFIDARRNLFVAELEILHLLSRLYDNFF